MTPKRALLASLLLAASSAFGAGEPAAPTAQATQASSGTRISSFAAGGGVIAPLGADYVALGNAPAFHADMFLSSGGSLDWRFTGFFIPYTVNNMPNTSVNIALTGVLAGLDYHALGSKGQVSTFFGVQAGPVLEVLAFPDAPATTQNVAVSLGVRATPGIELPLGSSVAALVDFPVLVIINKRTAFMVGSSLSLRFNL